MSKYKVTMTRRFTQSMERIVEAAGPDEAEKIALDTLRFDGMLLKQDGDTIAVAPPLPEPEPAEGADK